MRGWNSKRPNQMLLIRRGSPSRVCSQIFLRLRDWFVRLGDARQLKFYEADSFAQILTG